MTLANQHAVVTGAGGAIGRAIALALADRGTRLSLGGRRADALEEVARRARAPGRPGLGPIRVYPVDLRSDSAIREFVERLRTVDPQVDVLVHSAGVIHAGPLEQARVEDFDEEYQVNLRAPFVLTEAILPMMPAPGGQVIFINSSSGLRAGGSPGHYAATKHALTALAESLRNELNPRGIRITSVYPGRTAGPLQAALYAAEDHPYAPEELLQPEDIATMVLAALELPWTAEVTDIRVRPMRRP